MIVLFNKPFNVLCQFTDEGIKRETLADYIKIPLNLSSSQSPSLPPHPAQRDNSLQ